MNELTLQQGLKELAALNPAICQKSFISTVFDLIFEEQKIIISTEGQASKQRLYLINAVIEADCQQRRWALELSFCSRLNQWNCFIFYGLSNEYESDSYSERYLALLDAYLQALRAEAEK